MGLVVPNYYSSLMAMNLKLELCQFQIFKCEWLMTY